MSTSISSPVPERAPHAGLLSAVQGPVWAFGDGTFPGRDYLGAVEVMMGESPQLVTVPSLPHRGIGGDLLARTAALTEGLEIRSSVRGYAAQPSKSELTVTAADELHRSFDALEEGYERWGAQSPSTTDSIILDTVGPVTLLSGIENSRGGRLISDPGARADLVEGLAFGIRAAAQLLHKRTGRNVTLALKELLLPAVLRGKLAQRSKWESAPELQAPQIVELFDDFRCALGREFSMAAGTFAVAAHVPRAEGIWHVVTELPFDVLQVSIEECSSTESLDAVARVWNSQRPIWFGISQAASAQNNQHNGTPQSQGREPGRGRQRALHPALPPERAIAIKLAKLRDVVGFDRDPSVTPHIISTPLKGIETDSGDHRRKLYADGVWKPVSDRSQTLSTNRIQGGLLWSAGTSPNVDSGDDGGASEQSRHDEAAPGDGHSVSQFSHQIRDITRARRAAELYWADAGDL